MQGVAIGFSVNGKDVSVSAEPDTPLLWVLREDLALTGTKFGCGISACGACSVHVDGELTRSCSVPVSEIAGKAVTTIEGLKAQKLAFQVSMAGSRVPKFKHNISGRYPHLEEPGIALLCTLLLRGPQTVGELRQRSERMVPFPDIPSVESELNNLINYPGGPLITFFAPGGGRKSATYAHLLCGEVSAPNAIIAITASEVPSDPSWKEKIEAEIASLRAEVAELKALLS
jgi:uncharacterized protein YceH (UPF0502 family)